MRKKREPEESGDIPIIFFALHSNFFSSCSILWFYWKGNNDEKKKSKKKEKKENNRDNIMVIGYPYSFTCAIFSEISAGPFSPTQYICLRMKKKKRIN